MFNELPAGGPAFPVTASNRGAHPEQSLFGQQIQPHRDLVFSGMTLRDYFAAKAMHALITADAAGGRQPTKPDHYAKAAYAVADAMLKARDE